MRLFPTVANIICCVCEMMRTQVSDRNYVSELLIDDEPPHYSSTSVGSDAGTGLRQLVCEEEFVLHTNL